MSLLGRLMGGGDIPEVDADEAKRRQDAGALVVDVREPDEWAAGHVVGERFPAAARSCRRTASCCSSAAAATAA